MTLHAKIRAEERFEFYLGDDDFAAMVEMIRNNQAVCLKRKSKRNGMFFLIHAGREWVVGHIKGKITTVMPAHWREADIRALPDPNPIRKLRGLNPF